MSPADPLDRCVDTLYASVCEPAMLHDALEAIRVFTEASSSTFATFDPRGNVVAFAAAGIDPAMQRAWSAHYADLDPRRPRAMAARPGEWIVDDDLLDPRRSPAREYVNDWAARVGFRWARGGKVFDGAAGGATFCVQRPAQMKAFDGETVRRLDVLLPHLQRVSRLTLELRARLPGVVLATAALDLLDLPLFVADEHMHLLHANQAGDEMLTGGQALRVVAGRLTAASIAVARPLCDAVRRACSGRPRVASVIALAATAAAHGGAPRPHWLRILPLGAGHRLCETIGTPAALVVVERSLRGQQSGVLQALFGFTLAEAELVTLLAAGHSAQAAAQQRGVSIATVRTQIKSLLAKTGTASQAQLMARVASLTPLR